MRSTFLLAILFLAPVSLLPGGDPAPAAEAKPEQFRLALSLGVIGELNRNDARASTMAWGKAILSQQHIVAETVPTVFDRPDDLFRALREAETDAVTVLTSEFLSQTMAQAPDIIFLAVKDGKPTQQYVLLVRKDGAIKDLPDLQGHDLELFQHASTCLAPAWLDTLLAARHLGFPEKVFGKITRNDRVSRVINRLFFRQTDACVVTRSAFEMAGELNPQVKNDLKVLATSEEVVPSLFFFRPGFSPDLRRKLQEAVLTLHETPAGKQVVSFFQGERMIGQTLSSLDSARTLLDGQHRLRSQTPAGEPAPAAP